MLVIWKRERLKELTEGQIWSFNHDPTLLLKIQSMSKKIPLSLVSARNFICEMTKQDPDLFPRGEIHEVRADWVAWISKQGFHIELKGDEYEILPSDATH